MGLGKRVCSSLALNRAHIAHGSMSPSSVLKHCPRFSGVATWGVGQDSLAAMQRPMVIRQAGGDSWSARDPTYHRCCPARLIGVGNDISFSPETSLPLSWPPDAPDAEHGVP